MAKVKDLVNNISRLEMKEEIEGLSMEVACKKEEVIKDFWRSSRFHESILCQKSRVK